MKPQNPNPWHAAHRVAKILGLENDLGPSVVVGDRLDSNARNPYVGVGVVGMNGGVYLAIGGVAPYTPTKGDRKGEKLLAWGYNAKTFLRIHGHEPTSAMVDIRRIRDALDSITEEQVSEAIRAAQADSSAPRSSSSLAELMG